IRKAVARRQLRVKAPFAKAKVEVRVIEIHPRLPTTRMRVLKIGVSGGEVVPDKRRDILKIAVVDRHSGRGRVGTAFVRGFGLREGALASSVAHDHHNLIAVGATDEEVLFAFRLLHEMQGGLVAVKGETALARLHLPIAGLLSDLPLRDVVGRLKELKVSARSLGCPLPNPFMTLSFVSLPTIPECGLTDRGLVDVRAHRIVSLLV
ncbi:MAG: adenine deaminase, partial [Acidobacteria bacterium]|nr:adenine deaminase [Acidobacteriota bacterium]